MNGSISGIGINSNIPNINLKNKVDIKSNINTNANYNTNIISPKIDINLKEPNIKMSEIDINSNSKSPKISMSPEGSEIKRPIKMSDYSLYGSIEGVKINSPKIDNLDYELCGNIPGIKVNQPNNKNKIKNPGFLLEGTIPSMKKNQISNIKINNNNSINNNHYRNNSKGETHSKRGNFHGNLNDPNYLDYNDLKGSRKPIMSSRIENEEDILSSKIDKNKLNIIGNKVIEEKDIILQEPFNINGLRSLSNAKRQSVYLTVSQLKIEPEEKNNININNNINNNVINNIHVEMPKVEIDLNNKEIKPKVSNENNINKNANNEIQNKINNESNYMSGVYSDEENSKVFSQRSKSKKKKVCL